MMLFSFNPIKYTPYQYLGVLVWNLAEIFKIRLKKPSFWFDIAMGCKGKRIDSE